MFKDMLRINISIWLASLDINKREKEICMSLSTIKDGARQKACIMVSEQTSLWEDIRV